MAANPYTAQLKDFSGGITNARRGLTDLYKLRIKGVEADYNYKNKLYGSAWNTTNEQYGNSLDSVKGFEASSLKGVQAGGYQTDRPEVDEAIKGIISKATKPYGEYLTAERGALHNWYKGYKGAAQYENKTLKTGLKRELPAALSELEQGIVDVQSNLQAQGDAFNQQQAYNASMQSYMTQMLSFQKQSATGQVQGGQGGGSGKETPNTLEWLNYAKSKWGVTVGGWRSKGSVPGSDHPKGRAIDIMSRGALGSSIANDFIRNAAHRGVSYVIWNRQIWTPGGGWKRYNGPNPHTDHVHVSFGY